MIVIEEKGPRITEEDVVAVERMTGSSLPDPYRKFLIKYNGGRPTPDTIRVEGLPGDLADIKEFFGIGLPIESSNLAWNWAMASGRIPDQLLPIASDSFGSRFCICLSGASRGSVVFCLLTFDEDDGTIYFVANSFDDFLDKIVSFESTPALN